MEYPLPKYKSFIEDIEKSLLFDNLKIGKRELTRINPRISVSIGSSRAIAKIVKIGKDFFVRYTYEGFNRIYDICAVSPLTHKLRRINSRNLLTHKILEEVIKYQRRYLETADPIDLVSLSQVQLPLDNSWTSRLVRRLSVITPSGEEKPLKWFFPTQRDINKRLIKQFLDKESEDLQSGKLKKPYTDNELKTLLEAFLREKDEQRFTKISRHSIGNCRKDMGIPPAGRRLSGYKYPPLSANFSLAYPLTMESVLKYAPASSGVYELSIKRDTVFYIGSTKNIKKRLREHLGKNSKNGRIRDILKKYECSFRYIQFSAPHFHKEEEGRLYSLFVSTYGLPPKCNRVRPGGN